ncbi:MAG: hypothetical protein K2P81_14225 [Bacteriovoracaceae bacterium]|nr:hypothetical protein [Bacteriovoracaceae bacterium]
MKSFCRLVMLDFLFAAMLLSGCATSQNPSKDDWEEKVKEKLSQNKNKFQTCSKYLKIVGKKPVEVSMTFRLNPTGALETLWLDESSSWDSRFYDCLFNVVDNMSFPAFEDDTSLEVKLPLVFRSRG